MAVSRPRSSHRRTQEDVSTARLCGRRPRDANIEVDGPSSQDEITFVITRRLPARTDDGFDIDCENTNCSDPVPRTSCRPIGSVKAICDSDEAIDNTALALADRQSLDIASAYEKKVREGRGGILIRVSGYAAPAPDDPEVYVSTVLSGGLTSFRCDAGARDPDAGPRFDSCDFYAPDPAYVKEGVLLIKPVRGRVVDYTLIVDEPTPMSLPFGNQYVPGTLRFLEAKVTRNDDGGFVMIGNAGGWVDPSDVLGAFAQQPLAGIPLCQQPTWTFAHDTVCGSLDLATPDAGQDAACEALSFGLRFEALVAQLSAKETADATVPDLPCPAGLSYSCP
jgi:hypothetical protein